MNDEIENKVFEPFKLGYYLESFGQLDILIDKLLFGFLNYQVHYDKLSYLLQKQGRLTGYNLSIILAELKTIGKKLSIDIRKFKEFRNKILHDPLSEAAIVLFSDRVKQASKKEKKKLVGRSGWENTYKLELNEYLTLGVEILKQLNEILSKYPPRYIDPKMLEEEIKE